LSIAGKEKRLERQAEAEDEDEVEEELTM